MWLYQAAKQVQEKVQEKATSIVAQVQDEAQLLLKTMGQMQSNPVDEIIFEELDDYKAFQDVFDLDIKTDDVAMILQKDEYISDLHTTMVPEQLSYKEFWTRYYFRQFLQLRQEEENAKREEERRVNLEKERELREKREKEIEEQEAEEARLRAVQLEKEMDVQVWKERVASLQEMISDLENADATRRVMADEDYEKKLAQMTLHIDDARASGYEEGIAESEQIVKSMRESMQHELKEVEEYLLLLTRPASAMPPPTTSISIDVANAIWSLHRSSNPDTQSQSTDSEVNALREENNSLKESLSNAKESLRELDTWKARAIKMKKMKDEADIAAKEVEEKYAANVDKAFQDGIAKGQVDMGNVVAELEAKLRAQAAEIELLKQSQVMMKPEGTEVSSPAPLEIELVADDQSKPRQSLNGERGDDWGEWD